jgi:hypothetical protein
LYVSFVERGFQLLGKGGRQGFILPNKFFRTDYGRGLRTFLTDNKSVTEVVNFGAEQVFSATTYTCLLFLSNQPNSVLHYGEAKPKTESLLAVQFTEKDVSTIHGSAWTFTGEQTSSLIEKLSHNSRRLLDLPAYMSRGSSTGEDTVFVLETVTPNIENGILREPVFASDFGRYRFEPSGKWRIIFPYISESNKFRLLSEAEIKNRYPKAFAYLYSKQPILKKRKQFRVWYGYSAARNLELHDRAKIIVPLLTDRGLFALLPEKSHGKLCPMASGGFTITVSDNCPEKTEYVLGLLNSRLLFWCLKQMSNIFRGGWITCTKQYFGELPIQTIDFTSLSDVARHDLMVSLVTSMLDLHKQLADTKTAHDREIIERQIEATDMQIDKLVYEMYGLTEEEIRIIEEGMNGK